MLHGDKRLQTHISLYPYLHTLVAFICGFSSLEHDILKPVSYRRNAWRRQRTNYFSSVLTCTLGNAIQNPRTEEEALELLCYDSVLNSNAHHHTLAPLPLDCETRRPRFLRATSGLEIVNSRADVKKV